MKIMGIAHVGLAVCNLDEAVSFFTEVLGGRMVSRRTIEEQKLISAIVKVGDGSIEIMESTGETGVIARFIAQKGEGMHHISLKVRGIKELVDFLEGKGLRIIGKQFDSPVKWAFIHPDSAHGLLIELVETDEEG